MCLPKYPNIFTVWDLHGSYPLQQYLPSHLGISLDISDQLTVRFGGTLAEMLAKHLAHWWWRHQVFTTISASTNPLQGSEVALQWPTLQHSLMFPHRTGKRILVSICYSKGSCNATIAHPWGNYLFYMSLCCHHTDGHDNNFWDPYRHLSTKNCSEQLQNQ